jgi:hypothetical protein
MADEHRGEGGSYLLDPETGERTLIKRTLPPTPSQETTDGPATAETTYPAGDGANLRDGSGDGDNRRRPRKRPKHHSPAE